ncbi:MULTISPECIES: chemotaxis protein CheW [unclassified Coleofasciculus]|uniref:chemotaxis protein CheW n=1 Tax=unclassified Coleofasciculus TaxID=2692782 RepID=UPI0018820EF2|nr:MULTISPECIES: chemotaxis protein CheW [unclassified Coleofasciculus]MBE9127887.1 chemotaxis protein CheW [Coleofasciculus sp. LEGE 07081]MBE9151079.1 chemotaxis protein CheW [Coleofasciculus sp. LEGE 07092]
MTSLDSFLTELDPLAFDPLPPDTRQRMLRFPLGIEDSALLPLEQIAEIIRIEVGDILPVPEMPTCVLGICNWRGEMLWLIELNHLMGYPALLQNGHIYGSVAVMVVQVDDQFVGLMVSQVNDIELHDLQHLQPATSGLFPPKLLPFILGALPGNKGVVLNATGIIEYPLWQVHRGMYSREIG